MVERLNVAEPNPPSIPTYLNQLIKESERDIPVALPDASLLIEAIKDLRGIIDAQAATNADFEQRIFDLENP